MGLFRTYRSDGTLQLDSDNMTYTFVSKGSVSTQGPVVLFSQYKGQSVTTTMTSSAVIPTNPSSTQVVAVMCNGYSLARYFSSKDSGGNWSDTYASNAPVGTTVNYYVFDKMSLRSPVGYGLELFDGNGHMTFSSNYPVMASSINSNIQSRQYATVLGFGGHSKRYYDEGINEDDSNIKNKRYYYTYSTDCKLAGASFSSNNGYYYVDSTLVSYYDTVGNAQYVTSAQSPQPADATNFDIPLQAMLLVDVSFL